MNRWKTLLLAVFFVGSLLVPTVAGAYCSTYASCPNGRKLSTCITTNGSGVCISAYYQGSDGKTFTCASCGSCYSAAKLAAEWCAGGVSGQPTCTNQCGGGCCGASELCCASMCAPAGSACCGSGYCAAGKVCCGSVCILPVDSCCGSGYCAAGQVCSGGKCCDAATPVNANGACCAEADTGCICKDGSGCGNGLCCPLSSPYCCTGGGCSSSPGVSCASAPNQPPPPEQICAAGTEPCGATCCPALSSCCNGTCISGATACCSGQACTSGTCCGNGCLPEGATCCPDSTTCPSATPVCCAGGGCSADAASCVMGAAACTALDTPCNGGCCSPGTPTCCSGGCAPAGSICCTNALYCPQDHPTCCGSYCCALGSTCSDNKDCVRASGALPPGTVPATGGAGKPPAAAPHPGEPVSQGKKPPGSGHRAEELGFGYSCGGCGDDGARGDAGASTTSPEGGSTGGASRSVPPGLGALLHPSENQGLALVFMALLALVLLRSRERMARMESPARRRPRWFLFLLLLAAPLCLPCRAAGREAKQAEQAGKACKAVLLSPRTTGIPAGVALLAGTTVREVLTARGCAVVDDVVVDAMWKLLELRPAATTRDLQKLGRSLQADWVMLPALTREEQGLRVELWALMVTPLKVVRKTRAAPVEQLFPTLTGLTGLALDAAAEKAPSPASPGAGTEPPPAEPTVAAATPPPGPAQAPATSHLAAPASEPTTPASDVPPPLRRAKGGRPTPRPAAVSQGPHPQSSLSNRGAAAELVATADDPYSRPRLMAASGLRVFHVFGSAQVGPAMEVELGMLRKNYRLGALYRAYFGETTSHFAGMRFEGGPRWGRLRLSLGADLGLVFTPNQGPSVDMLTIGLALAGLTVQVWRVELHLSAFNLDIYVVPQDALGNTDVEAWAGFNSGLSAAFFF